MNPKVIGFVGIITAILVGIVMLSGSEKTSSTSSGAFESSFEEGENLLPDVSTNLDEVNGIVIEKGTETLTLYKEDDTWRLEEKNGYFVQGDQVQELLIGFRNFDFLEQKTSNPDFYERLGLQEPGEGLQSTRVILKDGDTELANVVLGEKKRSAGTIATRYVRMEGKPETYLVETNADPTGNIRSWLQTDILDLPPTRLSSIEITRWDDQVVSLDKLTSETVDWQLADLPEGAEISNQNTINTIGRSLAGMSHNDVQKLDVLNFDSLSSETTFAAQSFDGIDLLVTLRADTSGNENKWWTKFDIEFNESLFDEINTDKTIEEVREEVDELKPILSDWAYQIPNWKATNMTKAMDELIEFPSEETAESEGLPEGLPPSGESMTLDDLSEFLTPEQLEQIQGTNN